MYVLITMLIATHDVCKYKVIYHSEIVTMVGHKNFYMSNFELNINYDAGFNYPPMHCLGSHVYTLISCQDFFFFFGLYDQFLH